MTDLYSTIEEAILAAFEADAWLGDTDNVKVIETDLREALLTGEAVSRGFMREELPAVQIKANLAPTGEDLATTNVIEKQVPVVIVSVSAALVRSTARDSGQILLGHLEDVLDAQKSSEADLGIDALVRDVKSTLVEVKDGVYWWAIGTTECTVLKQVSF